MIAEEGPPQEILIYSTKASGEFLFQLYMLCDNFNIDFVKKRKPQTWWMASPQGEVFPLSILVKNSTIESVYK